MEPEGIHSSGVSGPEPQIAGPVSEECLPNEGTPPEPTPPTGINIFNNSLLLDKILSYQPIHELCKMREVNREICERALHYMQRRGMRTVYLGTVTQFNIFLDLVDVDQTETEENPPLPFPFTSFFIVFSGTPTNIYTSLFSKYGHHVLDLCFMNEPCYEDDEPIYNEDRRGWEYDLKLVTILQNTSHLQTLTFSAIRPDDIIPLQYLQSIEDQLSQLRLLEVHTLTYCWTPNSASAFRLFKLLIKLVPNVKSLTVVTLAPTYSTLKPLGISRLNLESLKCSSKRVPATSFLSQFKSQKLRELDVTLSARTVEGVQEYTDFFKSQRSTLETLVVRGTREEPARRVELPGIVMQKLEKITFRYDNIMGIWPMLPLNAAQVPNLKVLHILLDLMDHFFEDSSFTQVSEIYVYRRGWSENFRDNLQLLPSYFPNVKQLKIESSGIGLSELPGLFSCLEELEALDILIPEMDGQNINSILSGIPHEDEGNVDQWNAAPEIPRLASMKELKDLTIRFDNSACPSKFILNDMGVDMGFMKMQRLLRLALFGDFTISEENKAKLTGHHANVFINHDRKLCHQ